MRLLLWSDLHLDIRDWQPPPIPDADVAVIAGDVREGLVESIQWAAETIRPHMPVVLVPGNHEFYGREMPAELAAGRAAAAAADVHLLECNTVEIGGCLFSGTTLWTDYCLDGESRRRLNMGAAAAGLRDHRKITWQKQPVWKRFRPEEAAALHTRALMFLGAALTDNPPTAGRPHVIVTHHAPSPRSVPTRFEGDALSPAFASDLDGFILRHEPTLWVHGHVHDRQDYRLGATRVVANPKGYPNEVTGFDPTLVVEAGS